MKKRRQRDEGNGRVWRLVDQVTVREMIVKLIPLERVMLMDVLPMQGNIAYLKLHRKLREALSFSEREIAAYGIKFTTQGVTWERGGQEEKEFRFGAMALETVKNALKDQEAAGKLRPDHLTLYAKFFPEQMAESEEVVREDPPEEPAPALECNGHSKTPEEKPALAGS